MISLREKGIFSSLILLSFLFVGCTNDRAIMKKMETIRSRPIDLCFSDMMCLNQDGFISSYGNDTEIPYRVIVFTGPDECSTCALNSLSEWNALLDLEKEKKVQLVFILCPEKSKLESTIKIYQSSGLEHSILIDTIGVFLKKNQHIPEEAIFHTFVLDSKGNVILVGNPLKNPKIQELFEKILKDCDSVRDK